VATSRVRDPDAALGLLCDGGGDVSVEHRVERVANEVVAILRSRAGRNPHDRDLSDLVGELSTQSEAFRKLWASHNVRFHDTGAKNFHHPVVGELSLTFETTELSADTGLTMFAFTAEPGSKSEEGLNLLASWAATLDQEEAAAPQES
jgi:MmyB-like transcription regulator ligand binding domain